MGTPTMVDHVTVLDEGLLFTSTPTLFLAVLVHHVEVTASPQCLLVISA